eukprot:7746576-Karenia_brevis.AAC.1
MQKKFEWTSWGESKFAKTKKKDTDKSGWLNFTKFDRRADDVNPIGRGALEYDGNGLLVFSLRAVPSGHGP